LNTNYVVLFTVVTLLSYLALNVAFGDQQSKDMRQALEIWNAAGCSVRDICTVCDFSEQECRDIIAPQIQLNESKDQKNESNNDKNNSNYP
jgi:trimethylamine:corrinoid methyltransferase-like protein